MKTFKKFYRNTTNDERLLGNVVGENGDYSFSNIDYNPMSDKVNVVVTHPYPTSAADPDSSKIPDWAICPIGYQIFRKPIIFESGITIEYSALESILSTAKKNSSLTFTCPVSGTLLMVSDYEKSETNKVNITTKKAVEEWLETHSEYNNDTYRHPEYKKEDKPVLQTSTATIDPQPAAVKGYNACFLMTAGGLFLGGIAVGFYYAAIAPCKTILLENRTDESMSPMSLTNSKTYYGEGDDNQINCVARPWQNVPYGSSIEMWYSPSAVDTTCTFFTTQKIEIKRKGYHVDASGYNTNGCTMKISPNGAKCSYKMETVCPTNNAVNSTAAALPMWNQGWLELPTKISEMTSVVTTIPRGIVSNIVRAGIGFFNLPLQPQQQAHLRRSNDDRKGILTT